MALSLYLILVDCRCVLLYCFNTLDLIMSVLLVLLMSIFQLQLHCTYSFSFHWLLIDMQYLYSLILLVPVAPILFCTGCLTIVFMPLVLDACIPVLLLVRYLLYRCTIYNYCLPVPTDALYYCILHDNVNLFSTKRSATTLSSSS